ncbi:hypothetical protein J7J23_02630 [bacterium]|nr:hypothetical protein [bacterium]
MLNAQISIVKILFLASFSAFLAVLWTPILTHFLYKHKLWRKEARNKTIDGKPAPVFNKLHNKRETRAPRLGGLLIWVTTIFTAFLFSLLAKISNNFWIQKLNFLSRGQTWLPLATLAAASMLGLGDDILQIFGKGKYSGGGIRFTRRLIVVLLIGIIGGLWFYYKLGWHTLHIPGDGDIEIGLWYLPLFLITILACWAGGIIDGIDGLAGGVFSIMFGAFAVIAFSEMKYNLAAFCTVVSGTTIAFLWFNIPPARFYMGETGSLGLSVTLAVVAFLTDSVAVLPIIAGLPAIEVLSVIIQLISKRIFKKKIFLCTPFHHHLEAKGWPPEKVTMRFWLISTILAIIGVAIRLLG